MATATQTPAPLAGDRALAIAQADAVTAYGDLTAYQVGSKLRQSIELTICPAIFDRDVAALDIASFAQALAERCHDVRIAVGRRAVQKPDHRHPRLLRPRRQRPGRGRGA